LRQKQKRRKDGARIIVVNGKWAIEIGAIPPLRQKQKRRKDGARIIAVNAAREIKHRG
jgi:hypothetical protein